MTNGIAHRRWLNQSNPELAGLITDLIGKDYIYDADKLQGLRKYTDDASVLQKLQKIKQANKERLAEYLKKTQGDIVDPSPCSTVQVKRLHEYKRQHMNALNILATYQWLRENPNADFTPHTFFFGAKAAPGYYFAKQIIQFIAALAKAINSDERVNKKLKVIFVENYCVTWAELLTPAAEISEQISLAGTEASGTSNMKFMINGAVTLGTLDGANVEIHQTVGDENIILFGMTASQVEELKRTGYHPNNQYQNDGLIHRAMDEMGCYERRPVQGYFQCPAPGGPLHGPGGPALLSRGPAAGNGAVPRPAELEPHVPGEHRRGGPFCRGPGHPGLLREYLARLPRAPGQEPERQKIGEITLSQVYNKKRSVSRSP